MNEKRKTNERTGRLHRDPSRTALEAARVIEEAVKRQVAFVKRLRVRLARADTMGARLLWAEKDEKIGAVLWDDMEAAIAAEIIESILSKREEMNYEDQAEAARLD